ncbi:MAG: hypothetical protein IJT42_01465, partial [Treponema sp.]|nr:hypothetical protein [Treponema sp.]
MVFSLLNAFTHSQKKAAQPIKAMQRLRGFRGLPLGEWGVTQRSAAQGKGFSPPLSIFNFPFSIYA